MDKITFSTYKQILVKRFFLPSFFTLLVLVINSWSHMNVDAIDMATKDESMTTNKNTIHSIINPILCKEIGTG